MRLFYLDHLSVIQCWSVSVRSPQSWCVYGCSYDQQATNCYNCGWDVIMRGRTKWSLTSRTAAAECGFASCQNISLSLSYYLLTSCCSLQCCSMDEWISDQFRQHQETVTSPTKCFHKLFHISLNIDSSVIKTFAGEVREAVCGPTVLTGFMENCSEILSWDTIQRFLLLGRPKRPQPSTAERPPCGGPPDAPPPCRWVYLLLHCQHHTHTHLITSDRSKQLPVFYASERSRIW